MIVEDGLGVHLQEGGTHGQVVDGVLTVLLHYHPQVFQGRTHLLNVDAVTGGIWVAGGVPEASSMKWRVSSLDYLRSRGCGASRASM